MKSLIILMLLSCSFSYSSEHCAVVSSDDVTDQIRELAHRVDSLLRRDLHDTQNILALIREVSEIRKGATHTQKHAYLDLFMNDLSVKWAAVLINLSSINRSGYVSLNEMSACITQLSSTVGSDLENIQKAWSLKQTLERKSQAVSSKLRARKIGIDELIEEEQRWNSRQLTGQSERANLPEPLVQVPLHTYAWYQSIQMPVESIKKILAETTVAVHTASADREDADGNSEEVDGHVGDNEKSAQLNQHVEELGRYIEWSLGRLARPSQGGASSTLEEIEEDLNFLLGDLETQSAQALRAIKGYRMTLEKIQANRQAYARYRNTESIVFDCEHSRLKLLQTEKLTLLARVKLMYLKQSHGDKKHPLSDEEIKLLVTYKEELSREEQTAVTKLQPDLLSRFKSFIS